MKVLLVLSLLALTALRLLLVLQDAARPEEAYLVMCGLRPALAYYDGPGGVPIGAAAGMTTGGRAALAWPLFALAATAALWFAARPVTGASAAAYAVMLVNALPAFNRAALEPGAAMPFLALGLVFLGAVWRALAAGGAGWWLLAGLCGAAALLFTYQAVLLPAVLVAVLAASHRWRPLLRRPSVWLALAPPVVPLALLLQWNAGNGWVHFIGGTWQTATTLDPGTLPPALQAAASAASPFALLALLVAAGHAFAVLPSSPKVKFVLLPSLVFLLAAVYLTLTGGTAGPAGLAALVVPVLLIGLVPREIGPWPARPTLAMALTCTALWTSILLATAPRPPAMVGPSVVREIESLKAGLGPVTGSPVILVAESAGLASAIAIGLQDRSHVVPGHPAVYVAESPAETTQFALWPRYDQFLAGPPPTVEGQDPFTEQDGFNPFIGATALFVTTQTEEDLPQAVTAAFAAHRLLAEITTPSGAILRVFLCSDYQTMPM